jgi:hypothetical protein
MLTVGSSYQNCGGMKIYWYRSYKVCEGIKVIEVGKWREEKM